MPKCEQCGKEIQLPFVCTYCKKTFCEEHRLPEQHQCSSLPKDPKFWYQKKKSVEEQDLRKVMHGGEVCPRCNSPDISVWCFDEGKANYECNICRHKWVQVRNVKAWLKEKMSKELQKAKLEEMCPKCRSFGSVLSFNKETVTYQCEKCHHKWIQPRKSNE